jgi:predicted O-methyltransferase YrrM
VRAALDGRALDVLFIDGDHSYEGVKRDWELYSPLVRAGGLIGLHDIQEDYATSRGTQTAAISGEVPRFWRELREGHRTEELIADPGQDGYGIGVVYA